MMRTRPGPIYRLLRCSAEYVCRKVASFYYVLRYFMVEARNRLPDQDVRAETGTLLSTGLWCIVAIHQRGQVCQNLTAFVKRLQHSGYNVILINDGPCSREMISGLLRYSYAVISRSEGGRDFGSYKLATQFLRQLGVPIEQVIYCNDSIFVRPSTVERLLVRIKHMHDDFIGVTDTYAPTYHVQSWFFAVSGELFNSGKFQTFWNRYRPISYRLHCINRGEIALSQHLGKFGVHPRVLYTQEAAGDLIFDGTLEEAIARLRLLAPYEYHTLADTIAQIACVEAGHQHAALSLLKTEVSEQLSKSNTMNATNLIFLSLTEFPFLKKDLVYRGQYLMSQIESIVGRWAGEDSEHTQAILTYFRDRGSLRHRYSPMALLARFGVI